MKKIIFTLILATISLVNMAAKTGSLKRYEISVRDFSELKIVHGININYVCNPDSAGMAVFESADKHVSMFMFNNTNDRLEIQLMSESKDIPTDIPTITVYSKFLTKVENSGDSTVTITTMASCPKFKARLIGNGHLVVKNINVTEFDGSIDTGNGTLSLYGSTTKAKLSCTGTGLIQAEELVSDNTNCRMLGTGSIRCQALTKLNITGMSSGKVYYKGNPKEVKRRSVGVKIIPLDNEQ